MNTFQEIPASKRSLSNRRLVYGIGINDAIYMISYKVNNTQVTCPYYSTWVGMLERCYCKKYHKKRPTYTDCRVCDSWLLFSNFKSWMNLQDWKGKQLDKDLLVRGNKIYSPETCIFVSSQVNSVLSDCKASRGIYLIGVTWDKSKNNFLAQCCIAGKQKILGRYSSEEEAHKVYIQHKQKVILDLINKQSNLKIIQALKNICNNEYSF